MAIIGQGISHRGLTHEPFHYAWNLAAGITAADVGKAMAVDSSAASTAKLAGDGDQVIGKLVTVEDRTVEGILVGTIAHRGGFKFTGEGAIAVGNTVVGSTTAGTVKAAAVADHADNIVVEVNGTDITIVR